AFSPLSRKAASCSDSRPSTSFSSQIPIPSTPAAEYAARSSSKLALSVENSTIENGWPSGKRRLRLALRGLEVRHHPVGEQLLRLDRLPVGESARVDRDRDLRQSLADLDRLLDALDHVVRRPDPDDVAIDHLLVRRLGQLLEDPGGVEAV